MTKTLRRKLNRLASLLPQGEIRFDSPTLERCASDKWMARRLPDCVALPRSVKSVSTILAFASRNKIPVTPRGAGYGYVGGCVPVRGGIALSTERMNRIKEINPADFVAVVQPGVITKTLQEKAEQLGLYYPPDPASRADSFIGGNIATNAGGPRCLKYGVTRDYILGLEVVMTSGDVLRFGGRTHKNKTGFDFTRLMVGSEGLLGVITEATLRLLPHPPFRTCLAIGFTSMKDTLDALAAILREGFLPCALEVADAFTLAAARERTGSTQLAGCNAHLIVELDGHEQPVRYETRQIQKIIRRHKPVFINTGFGGAAAEKVWSIRRQFSYSLRDTGLTKLNQDIVVPRGRLQDLFRFARELQKKYGFPIACFGHAGDGNIHCNIMVDFKQHGALRRSDAALDELFRQVLAWDGVITGEHGIGLAKKPWWTMAVPPNLRRLHRSVKRTFDPGNILNPGKFA